MTYGKTTEAELLAALPIEMWTECEDGQALLALAREGKCRFTRVNSTLGRFDPIDSGYGEGTRS